LAEGFWREWIVVARVVYHRFPQFRAVMHKKGAAIFSGGAFFLQNIILPEKEGVVA
jgi:hypothetical protein